MMRMRNLSADLRHALRMFRAHHVITLIAVLSLAVGIGANTVMFSLADGMFLRPLPVRDPAGLVSVFSRTADGRGGPVTWLDYADIARSVPAFADLAAQSRRGARLEVAGESQEVLLTVVSDNYFPLLGVQPARGRLFRADLDERMREPAVAISDSLWRRRFGSDPSLIGRPIRLNTRAYTVVAILPPEFRGLERFIRNDVWVPVSTWKAMGAAAEFGLRDSGDVEPLARLRPGATLQQVQAQLDALAARFQQDYPRPWHGRRLSAATDATRRKSDRLSPAVILMALTGLLLLIACANVAMLLLSHAERRRREMGIRLAVGARRTRLVAQLLTENAVLAVAGGLVAVLLGAWLIPLAPALLPPGPDYISVLVQLDRRVLLVTAASALLTVLLFGLAPALAGARTDLNHVLKGGAVTPRRRFAGRSVLVVAQAALAVALLHTAGSLTRSFFHSQTQRPGFDTDRPTLLVEVNADGNRPAAECDRALARIAALPGIRRAAYCRRIPMAGSGGGATRDVVIPGRAAPGEAILRLPYNQVSPDYFALTGTRLLSGRAFTAADAGGASRVALVNETMARQYWPDGSAVGRWIRVGRNDTQVVGVVEDTAIWTMHDAPQAFLYFPFAQAPAWHLYFLLETTVEPGTLAAAVKREMRAASPVLDISNVTTLKRHLREALYIEWLPAVLSSAIGALGLLLGAIGVFGVVMHSVNRQLREFGIRMAMGASTSALVVTVVRRGFMLSAAGACAGVALSFAAGRLLAGSLYGVSPYDPATLAFSVAVVVAVAVSASFYPALTAARVDPAAVLRNE